MSGFNNNINCKGVLESWFKIGFFRIAQTIGEIDKIIVQLWIFPVIVQFSDGPEPYAYDDL